MHVYECCLSNKYAELRGKLDTVKPDILGITEVWDKESFVVQGYHPPFRKDRLNRVGGGVLLLVRDSLEVIECKDLNDSEFEDSVWCEIKTSQSVKLLVGVCYRSPSSSHENNLLLNQVMEAAQHKGSLVLVMGDFNYSQICWEEGSVEGPEESDPARFFSTTQDLFLCQHVAGPTRFRQDHMPSRLDLVFTSEETMIDEVVSSSPLGKSDHVVLTWKLYSGTDSGCGKGKTKDCNKQRQNFKKANYQGMCDSLAEYDWSVLEGLEVEDMWKKFTDMLNSVIHKFVPPAKVLNRSRPSAPWWTSELDKQVKRKAQAWRDYTTSRREASYNEYKQQRNKSTDMIRKARRDFEGRLVKDISKQPKRLFQYIRSQQKSKATISSLESEGRLTESDTETAEALQKFFMSVFVKEEAGPLPAFPERLDEDKVITDVDCSPQAVLQELKFLQEDKAAGPDEIPSAVLKHCAVQLAVPLSCIFRATLATGKLPQEWKKARITPIFKKGSRNKPGNYRPVSLTSQVCKVQERILKKAITAHLSRNHLLSDQQHGFTQKRSCMTNLLTTLEDWTAEMDRGNPVDCVYLDYQKAFDSVPHRRLIKKLQSYGIKGNLLAWIQDLLSDRWQKVVIGNGESEWGLVSSGQN